MDGIAADKATANKPKEGVREEFFIEIDRQIETPAFVPESLERTDLM
jgi:hypothetical protein